MRTRRLALAVVATLVVAVVAVVLAAAPAGAHPLGNFTTNTYAGLALSPDRAVVDYVVDLAEIPTVQTGAAVEKAGAPATCRRLARRLRLSAGHRLVTLAPQDSSITTLPGQAGLSTLRIECRLAGPAALGATATITFADRNYGSRLGWREVTAVGDGVRLLRSDVPAQSTSARLTAYPERRLQSPLDVRSARLRVEPQGPATGEASDSPSPSRPLRTGVKGVDSATQAFTSLVADRALTPGFAVVALVAALAVGGLHALAPGHGKTVMAAYLVGQRGSRRQALAVGVTVAITHTAGVLALGIALTASQVAAPQRLYPVLGLVGGVMVAAVGAGLLARSVRHRRRHNHDHGHHHHHDPAPLGRRGLVAMGLAGGLVPSPSAVVVLLGAVALGRAWFGVALVLAYGAGMAATLVLAGLLLSRLSDTIERLLAGRNLAGMLTRVLPAVSASVIVVVGLAVALRSSSQL